MTGFRTAVYFIGDDRPLVLGLSVEQVAARLLDAEAQAEECSIPGRGWARFAGKYGPTLVRPSTVTTLVALAPEGDCD